MAKFPLAKMIYLTQEIHKAIKETAKRMNMSQAEWLRRAIKNQIEKDRWA